VCGVWCVVCGVWRVVCVVRCAVCGVRCVVCGVVCRVSCVVCLGCVVRDSACSWLVRARWLVRLTFSDYYRWERRAWKWAAVPCRPGGQVCLSNTLAIH